MGTNIWVLPKSKSSSFSQCSFHLLTVLTNVGASNPMAGARAAIVPLDLIQPLASSALLSSLQSYLSTIVFQPLLGSLSYSGPDENKA